MPISADIAPIIWAKWGFTFLDTVRLEALEADDGLAFRALNNARGIRMLLAVCTTDRTRIETMAEALALGVTAHPPNWETYSVAEMIFRTEKRGGLAHQELLDESGRTALVLCATRPGSVRTLEELCELPA